jgi:hypothetical protein
MRVAHSYPDAVPILRNGRARFKFADAALDSTLPEPEAVRPQDPAHANRARGTRNDRDPARIGGEVKIDSAVDREAPLVGTLGALGKTDRGGNGRKDEQSHDPSYDFSYDLRLRPAAGFRDWPAVAGPEGRY